MNSSELSETVMAMADDIDSFHNAIMEMTEIIKTISDRITALENERVIMKRNRNGNIDKGRVRPKS